MLTRAQKKAYQFIQQFIKKHHCSPTLAEVAKGIGIQSKGVAHRYIAALANAGLIRLIPNRHRSIELIEQAQKRMWSTIPLVGTIAAGQPIEAILQEELLDLQGLLDRPNCYALKVKGDSMIDEGIFDGDVVLCEHCDSAKNGDIVVALIDQQEATLKRLKYNSNGTITLIPANSKLSPLIYEANRIQIQGRFIGLLRLK